MAGLTPADAIIGPFVQVVLHGVALGVFDLLKIPVWGNADDAADRVAAFISLEFGDKVGWVNIMGTAWFLSQKGFGGVGDFTSTYESVAAQRFYNYLCVALGYDPDRYTFLARDGSLPVDRAERCSTEFDQLRQSFTDTIMQHVDGEKLADVEQTEWLP